MAADLEGALQELAVSGRVEVHENGRWLATLYPFQFEVHNQGASTLLHLWSAESTLVRRILRVAEKSAERLVLEIRQFGRRKPGKLELLCGGTERTEGRLARENFRERFRQLLAEEFPDERIDSLTTAADLEHSLSGCFTRGLLHRGQQAWAVLGASASEDAATIEGILTFGLVWLHCARGQADGRHIAGLRLFLPEGTSRTTTHRLSALNPLTPVELYEINETLWRARRVETRDIGNLATWLTPLRELEFAISEAREAVERIRRLAPEGIGVGVPPGTRDVALRFRGVEFARLHRGKISFGLGDHRQELTAQTEREFEGLVRELETYRHPLARDTAHPLYRAQPERWLEAMVQADPARVEARLDSRHLYSQVPAFAAGDRGVIDLLGVTREGRLAVVELKAAEDIHLPLQAVDYWLRVRWHQRQDDFHRYGYFTGVELHQKPPLLYLVAPGLRFHPTTDTILRSLFSEVEVTRVGLNENWRQGLRVVFRQ